MKLTEEKKQEIAAIVAKKAESIENGIIRIWMDVSTDRFKITMGSHEFRDNSHKGIMSFQIINERHPYQVEDVLDKLDDND